MRFIHIADVHLGASPDTNMPWGPEREKEFWNSLSAIIHICNEEKVELLVIAGDLFHRQPLLRELKEVNYMFGKLSSTKVVLMAGNHDFIGPRSYYQEFQWNKQVHMFLKDKINKFEFDDFGVEVYGLSFCTRDITEPLYDGVRPDYNGKFHILLAHGGDEKNIPMNRKKLLETGFDYIALGHIHKPEIICDRMAYAGSLEPTDKNDIGERGYILGEISRSETGKVTTRIQFVPNSIREYKRLSLLVNRETTNGSLLDQVKEVIRNNGDKNIYSLSIKGFRDETVHFDREALLKIGNILEVEDRSVPDYDFDALYRENEGNMIGMFIKKIRENSEQDEVAKMALYYGIEALLGSRD